ncbi:condensation domain-containing protein, partial [Streptomyces sp. NPDC093097]|uniref:condensation domain-containing protein n=1 Tax=Streptomyces sp. NPDC093097 TaxID=3366027 RepID=UPI00382FFBEB
MIPLSFAQRRLWFLDRMEGPSATYNLPVAIQLTGELDRSALRQALADVIGRHEALRTIFPDTDGEPTQIVLDAAAAVELPVREIGSDELADSLRESGLRPFDLATDLPMRAELFALGVDAAGAPEHVLLLTLHHIVGDGGSMGPLTRDLATAYAARCVGRAPE